MRGIEEVRDDQEGEGEEEEDEEDDEEVEEDASWHILAYLDTQRLLGDVSFYLNQRC